MTPNTPPNRRQKWTKQQYKEIIWAYQYAKKKIKVKEQLWTLIEYGETETLTFFQE